MSADLRADATGAVERKMPGPLQRDISMNRQGHPSRFISTRRVVWISLAILVALGACDHRRTSAPTVIWPRAGRGAFLSNYCWT